ncbi:beta-2-glycoprotein 1-like [Pelmatolapia mariae]|uniref:beta-2-glycoprotein 1-like n=1 Tax=Pelmatolapia mariae TaxID=158779 RepID=UPI002FE5F3E2
MERWLTLLLLFPVLFFSTVTSAKGCRRPQLNANINVAVDQMFFDPGVALALSCKDGYTPISGPRTIVCTTSGAWTATKLLCKPKLCPYPDSPSNGDLYYEDTVYQSTINYTCQEGYILSGSSTSVCQANGTWSTPVPECIAVTCGLPPIPEFGMIVYNTRVRGNTTDYGITGTYKCLPPYALFGDATAECTTSGTWTKTPECRRVTCALPENINRGYMSTNDQRDFDYLETIKYGCTGDYVVEGSLEIVCQQDGTWSEKPSCKAPCQIGINRGRILYKGKKMWIEDFKPNKVLHKDIVSVWCMNNARKCGYSVSTQCIDGRLMIPECYEEPSGINYNLHSGSLPSEIQQC